MSRKVFEKRKDDVILAIITGVSITVVFFGLEFIYDGVSYYYQLEPFTKIILGVCIATLGFTFLIFDGRKYILKAKK